jgi:nucleoid-associated protein YgaU
MPKLEKAFIAIKGKQFPVMYNPTEYSSSMTAVYGGLDEPEKKNQFQQTQNDNFSITLFFDTYEQQTDVRQEMKPIADLILPTVKKRKFKEPPVCTFVWGKFSYRGVIVNQSQKFTMFLPSGIPVRATLSLTFESRLSANDTKALSNRSSSRKFWTVKADDRLDLIAYKTLDNAANWKVIANFNNINDPLLFPRGVEKGRQLVIPDLG